MSSRPPNPAPQMTICGAMVFPPRESGGATMFAQLRVVDYVLAMYNDVYCDDSNDSEASIHPGGPGLAAETRVELARSNGVRVNQARRRPSDRAEALKGPRDPKAWEEAMAFHEGAGQDQGTPDRAHLDARRSIRGRLSEVLIDTNILVYVDDPADDRKQDLASPDGVRACLMRRRNAECSMPDRVLPGGTMATAAASRTSTML